MPISRRFGEMADSHLQRLLTPGRSNRNRTPEPLSFSRVRALVLEAPEVTAPAGIANDQFG